ncbi:Phosphate carrier protein, mitochondrial [Trichinella nativa]|uniref:Phosphate carrier protein, mitochondrial n=1 Tax=Trichinella nativa TaxID=6335 RepID=A0A0V1LD56_9BILA|nr:Phosphate carrier protein, mitochondrial [Trichinella nativa]
MFKATSNAFLSLQNASELGNAQDLCISSYTKIKASNMGLFDEVGVLAKYNPFSVPVMKTAYCQPNGKVPSNDEYSCEFGSGKYFALCGLGGVVSCGLTHTGVVPLDLVKCRIQVNPEKYRGIANGFKLTVSEEGIRGLARGWAPTAIGYSLQGLGKFGFYEIFKVVYSNALGEENSYLWRTSLYLAASASAEFFADIMLAPMEACKVRIQTQPGCPSALRRVAPSILRQEGMWGFYKGIVPLWMRQIPYTMMKFACFERTVELLYRYVVPKPRSQCSKPEQLGVTFIAGYIAGVFCALVSHPADSVVSKLNQDSGSTAAQALRKLGWRGVWKGLLPRIIMIGTLTALQWFIYDFVKVTFRMPRPPPPEMPDSLRQKYAAMGKAIPECVKVLPPEMIRMIKDGYINIINELRKINFLFKRILLYDAVCAKLDQIYNKRWSYLLIDFLVGLSLFLMMRNATFVNRFAENCEIYIMWIQRLIEWLMGAPGGLKLNKPLNTALGSFFIYHITLWRRYLYILRPLIHFTALSFNYASLFGISISLAVLYDSISLFTVHVFCFYVYAGRFYQLQLNGLISLGRLFRGKKYNPLRNRVDSCCFDKEQLLLGTVAFTIFFFLLPTIFTYYVVFSSLRFIVFVVQSVLLSVVRQFQFNRCNDEESGLMWSVFKALKCVLFGTLL